MDVVKITCTDTDKTLNGDVLRKSDKFIEVAIEGTGAKLRLSKNEFQLDQTFLFLGIRKLSL